jgi:hypothetical protein
MSSSVSHLAIPHNRPEHKLGRGWIVLGLALASWAVVGTLGYGIVQLASVLTA